MIQVKNTAGEVRIYVDLRKLNDAFLNDSFPTPFIDEIFKSIEGKEMYSFTNGFYGYKQVIIMKEYRH